MVAAFVLLAAPALAGEIAGTAPTYIDRELSTPPNADAIRARMWVPGLDDGYVPQGLAVAGDRIILSAYNSQGRQPACRLYRIDRATLAVTGHYDLAAYCSHAGGLAWAGGNRLFVADTGRLYELDLAKAFEPPTASDALVKTLSLRFPLKGSFLAYRDGALLVGVYKKPGAGTLYELPLGKVAQAAEPAGLSLEHVVRELEVAPMSQGAAVDADGFLWLSQSNSQQGTLQKLDLATGAVLATYAVMAGIEDLGFDADGRLWASSEAGARRWSNWAIFYPLLFSLDVGALR